MRIISFMCIITLNKHTSIYRGDDAKSKSEREYFALGESCELYHCDDLEFPFYFRTDN